MPDTTTHSQDPRDPLAEKRIEEARKGVANAELRRQSAMDLLRSAEAAGAGPEHSVSVKRGTPVRFFKGVREVPISNCHSPWGRSHFQVALKTLAVQLECFAGVVTELDRNGRVQPEEQAQRISVVFGSDNSQAEAFSLAKKLIRDRMYVGQRNIVDRSPGPVVYERAHNRSPSLDDAGAHSVGDIPGTWGASANPATEVNNPHISARYDAPLNAIAMSIGGKDDVYFDRDATVLLIDELLSALRDQAKNGGLA